ncbi:hypothetical protein GCM10020255_022180 [Rhodococcus baikonurensis]
MFISQQAKDIQMIEKAMTDAAETDQNQFSTVFVFMQKGTAEAKQALSLLREPSDANEGVGRPGKTVAAVQQGR